MINPSLQAEETPYGIDNPIAEEREREWWEPFTPLLIILLLLAVVLSLYWQSYPDLVPLFAGLMILISAALWYVAWRVGDILKSSRYTVVQFKPDGTPVTKRKRRFIAHLIQASATMILLAAINMVMYVLLQGDFESGNRSLLSYILVALVFTATFVIMWLGRATGLERFLDSYLGFWIIILLGMAIVGGVFFFTAFRSPALLAQGPPASWSTLLQFAQHQANKIDKGAVVESIIVDPPYYLDPPFTPKNTPFLTAFVFRRPNASSIRIEVFDTDPPRLQKVKDKWDYLGFEGGTGLPADLLPTYNAHLQYVRLSPRNAYQATEQEGLAFTQAAAPGHSPDVHMSTFMEHDWQKWFGVPAGWNVEYTVSLPGGSYKSLNLRVDGATGKVLARERWPEDLGSKPSPTP
jgi:hypothetical protein